MPPRVKLVHREASVDVPVSYTLEPGESFEFASVRAKVNGAGAAGTFNMVLEALSQDGKIITQSPIEQDFAVGDTGALTWAPFLRRAQAAAAGASLDTCYLEKTATQSITNGTFNNITTYNVSGATGVLSASTSTGRISFTETGIYLVHAGLGFSTNWATGSTIIRISALDQDQAGLFIHENDGIGYGSGNFWPIVTAVIPVTALGSPENDWTLSVFQASGSSRTMNACYFTATRLAALP